MISRKAYTLRIFSVSGEDYGFLRIFFSNAPNTKLFF